MTIVCLAYGQQGSGRRTEQVVDRGWQMRGLEREPNWMPARVPGAVHLDLLANGKIADPFDRDNEKNLQWIEGQGWEYRTSLNVPKALLMRRHVELVFAGLDAVADVSVNGRTVLHADNMFRQWRVEVKSQLHVGANELRVSFPSPIRAAAEVAAKDAFRLRSKTADKTYVRKAAYEYGWDWGPRLVTSGIWRPVRVEAWDGARIEDVAIRQPDVTAAVAHLVAEVTIESDREQSVVVGLTADQEATRNWTRTAHLHAGRNVVAMPVDLEHPQLWYPAGYGAQPLTTFTTTIRVAGQVADQKAVLTGLRSVELRRNLDGWGRSFEFVVNGVAVFAKGADVIPFDSFPTRVGTAQYRRILESAVKANMNMVRAWGGGYYETDEFYGLCDELGLMVWQDFMYGNDWQPGTYEFKQQMETEAEEQVRRLRNHPSIVLWCGNNETEMAYGWAPRPTLPEDVKHYIWQDYLTEFSGILPRVVAKLEGEVPYWPSSPSADYENVDERFASGDQHDWSVWHGRVPFSEYEKHHWRFVSEFGFQSFPEMRTVESFTRAEDRSSIFTPVMLAHQKNDAGNAIIHDAMVKEFGEPKDFASFLYASQVLQAEAVKIGAEHWRSERPRTMGSLYWQLNDCWPVASWSSIDYAGRWKALQYYARRFYAPVLVAPHVEDGAVKVYVISDKLAHESAELRVEWMEFNGKVLAAETKTIDVAGAASKVYATWPLARLTGDLSRQVLVVTLSEGDKTIARNLLYLAPNRELRLEPGRVRAEIYAAPLSVAEGNVYVVHLHATALARAVRVSFGGLDAEVEDNFMDLLPGETRTVTVTSKAGLDALRRAMMVESLADAFPSTVGSTAIVTVR